MMMMTYETLIKEFNTKKLTKRTLPKFIDKCSQVCDEIGCELMEEYSRNLEWTPEMLALKQKQKKLIRMTDILFNTYNNLMTDSQPTTKRDNNVIEGLSREYAEGARDYTWFI